MGISVEGHIAKPSKSGTGMDPEGETVTVQSVSEREFDDGQKKIQLDFLEDDQKLYLNKTQARRMVELFGMDTDDWVGKSLQLTPFDTNMGKSIRIDEAAAAEDAEVDFA